MLDAIGAGLAPRIGDRDWKDIWLESPEYGVMRREIEEIKQDGLSRPAPPKEEETTCKPISEIQHATLVLHMIHTDATPFWTQLQVVAKRNTLALWRMPDYVFSRLFVHVFISLFISLSFLQLGRSSRELQYRVFGM